MVTKVGPCLRNSETNDVSNLPAGEELLVEADLSASQPSPAERSEVRLKVEQQALRLWTFEAYEIVDSTGLNPESVSSVLGRLVRAKVLTSENHPQDGRRRIFRVTEDPTLLAKLYKRVRAYTSSEQRFQPASPSYLQYERTMNRLYQSPTETAEYNELAAQALSQLRTAELAEGGSAMPEPLRVFMLYHRLRTEYLHGSRRTDPDLVQRLRMLETVAARLNPSILPEVQDFRRYVQTEKLLDEPASEAEATDLVSGLEALRQEWEVEARPGMPSNFEMLTEKIFPKLLARIEQEIQKKLEADLRALQTLKAEIVQSLSEQVGIKQGELRRETAAIQQMSLAILNTTGVSSDYEQAQSRGDLITLISGHSRTSRDSGHPDTNGDDVSIPLSHGSSVSARRTDVHEVIQEMKRKGNIAPNARFETS